MNSDLLLNMNPVKTQKNQTQIKSTNLISLIQVGSRSPEEEGKERIDEDEDQGDLTTSQNLRLQTLRLKSISNHSYSLLVLKI